MSNQKKQKNANYTQKGREQATTRLVPSPRGLTRFFLGKTDILSPGTGKRSFPYFLLAFLIPFLGGTLAMYFRADTLLKQDSSYVFSILYSDAYYQYYPFFVDFRDILRSGGSLLYSWNVGMGTDYLGLFAYYVASPLNWLSALIPEGWLLHFYTFLVPIRMGFAGMFFAIFLQKVFQKNDISIALFGSFYATCAWVTGFMWNTMWLDSFAIAPLVILGTYNILKHRKFLLYTFSLFFCIFTNYYIGYFICIFTLLTFICYEICYWENLKKFLIDLGLMALFTLIAIGMTAMLTLPTYAALQTTSSSGSQFPQKLALHIAKDQTFEGFLGAMVTVITNSFAAIHPNYKDYASSGGLPNIYCGLFAGFFALLFLTYKQVKWRERICAMVMVLFLSASFIIKQLDYIWHGFHITNAIPNRFSFLYSFVILTMAYRGWTLRRRLEPWQVITTAGVTLIGLFLSPGLEAYNKATETGAEFSVVSLFPLVNILILLLLLCALFVYCFREPLAKKARWKAKRKWYQNLHLRRSLGSLALVAIISLELIFNIISFGNLFPVQTIPDYPRSAEDTAKAVAYMESQNDADSFYRAETAQHQSYNDGMLNGYNGISTFSSAANVKVTNYLKALGISAQDIYNRFVYEEGSPLSHLFLNLKYIIERRGFVENNPYLTDVYSSGKVHLMENNLYLPVGFMVDEQLKDLSFDNPNSIFGFQNQLLSAALGADVTAWTEVDSNRLSITSDEGITLSNVVGSSCHYSLSKTGYVYYTYSFEETGFFSVHYQMRSKNTYYVDYKAAGTNQWVRQHSDTHNGLSFIGSVCQVNPGDQVRIKVQCKPGNSYKTLNLKGALLDEAVMRQAYDRLSVSTLDVTKFTDTCLEGNITCQESGLLYTSIPQVNGNWHAYVDGKEADITLIGDAMVGVMLDEGPHTITFRYRNQAFQTGLTVSIVCGAALLVICVITILRKQNKTR